MTLGSAVSGRQCHLYSSPALCDLCSCGLRKRVYVSIGSDWLGFSLWWVGKIFFDAVIEVSISVVISWRTSSVWFIALALRFLYIDSVFQLLQLWLAALFVRIFSWGTTRASASLQYSGDYRCCEQTLMLPHRNEWYWQVLMILLLIITRSRTLFSFFIDYDSELVMSTLISELIAD